MAALRHWQDWRKTCALARCTATTRAALHRFAASRWRRFAAVCAERAFPDASILPAPDPTDAWHDFESAVRLRNTRRGKAYKQWLFARAAADDRPLLNAVQGGATLIMRDVVRERFRREMPRAAECSLDAPVPGGRPDGLTLLELLPADVSPADDVQEREFRTLGEDAATVLCSSVLGRRQKLALLARASGISLSESSLLMAAGCGKSVLSGAFHEALRAVARTVNHRLPGEDRLTRARVAIAAMEALPEKLRAWARAERSVPRQAYEVGRRRVMRAAGGSPP